MSPRLPHSFYSRPTLSVARDLLGKYIVRRSRGGKLVGMIVEVEAYLGEIDPASHAYRGKTNRNSVMFGPAGHLYVYFTYGMHFCSNIVTERPGKAGAVLLRAVQPISGIPTMVKNRWKSQKADPSKIFLLTNGPAKFCQAFNIMRSENGLDLTEDPVYLTEGIPIPTSKIGRSPRIGIRNGRNKLWRYYVKENKWVSRQDISSWQAGA